VLRRIVGQKKEKGQGTGENCVIRKFMIFCCTPNLIEVNKSKRMRMAEHV
jgi:hypothetical protein